MKAGSFEKKDFWCLFKCWLEERTLCKEPDLFWGKGIILIGGRKKRCLYLT